MNRRQLLKGVAGAAGAMMGALAMRGGNPGAEVAAESQDDEMGRLLKRRAELDMRYARVLADREEADARYREAVAGRLTTFGYSVEPAVDLERAWRIINDPAYVNYVPPGTDASGVFPEYDWRFPIERTETVDGWYAYHVRDTARGVDIIHTDHGLLYADATIPSMELTARALYAEHLAIARRGSAPPLIALQRVTGTALTMNTLSSDKPFSDAEIANVLTGYHAMPELLRIHGHRVYEEGGRHFLEVRAEAAGLTARLQPR